MITLQSENPITVDCNPKGNFYTVVKSSCQMLFHIGALISTDCCVAEMSLCNFCHEEKLCQPLNVFGIILVVF